MNSLRSENYLLFITIVVLLALGIVLDRLGYLEQFRRVLQVAFTPAQRGVSLAAAEVNDILAREKTRQELQQDNIFLQAEVNRLLVENIQLQELARENQHLRELLNYIRNNPTFDYTTASVVGRVIGADPTNLRYTIFIDVGARAGIAKDMPVVTERGLAGRVIQVNPNSTQVLLTIDPASSVNAIIQTSRVEGIVHGELDGTLVMTRIAQGETVSPGDLVLTSGLGGTFPDKLVIGQVIEVFQQDLELFQSARIRPTVDFGNLETVLVITTFEPLQVQPSTLERQEPP
jgi:rod shape-determining protein MreC